MPVNEDIRKLIDKEANIDELERLPLKKVWILCYNQQQL